MDTTAMTSYIRRVIDNAPARVYLAGPTVFRPNWKDLSQRMKQACAATGLVGVFPMDAEISVRDTPQATGRAICAANMDLIHSCDAIVADLSPFRGPSADVGTVWEFAYAQGLGKIVAAYSSDPSEYKTRVNQDLAGDDAIEDFGLRDNLMLEGSLAANGSRLYDTLEDALEAIQDDLALYAMLRGRKRAHDGRHLTVCD